MVYRSQKQSSEIIRSKKARETEKNTKLLNNYVFVLSLYIAPATVRCCLLQKM